MAKEQRLNKVLRELNISMDRAVDFLASKGITIEAKPTVKISGEIHQTLAEEFQSDISRKVNSREIGEEKKKEKEARKIAQEKDQAEKQRISEEKAIEEAKKKADEVFKTESEKAKCLVHKGNIDLNKKPKVKAKAEAPKVEAPKVE